MLPSDSRKGRGWCYKGNTERPMHSKADLFPLNHNPPILCSGNVLSEQPQRPFKWTDNLQKHYTLLNVWIIFYVPTDNIPTITASTRNCKLSNFFKIFFCIIILLEQCYLSSFSRMGVPIKILALWVVTGAPLVILANVCLSMLHKLVLTSKSQGEENSMLKMEMALWIFYRSWRFFIIYTRSAISGIASLNVCHHSHIQEYFSESPEKNLTFVMTFCKHKIVQGMRTGNAY